MQTFPAPKSRWQVSTQGGTSPVWRRDGLAFDSPRALFVLKLTGTPGYDAAPDGQRFLVGTPVADDKDARELTIITNMREFPARQNR